MRRPSSRLSRAGRAPARGLGDGGGRARLLLRLQRPPLLKDFFDPKIGKVFPVKRMEKMIEVSFEIREYDVPCA